MHPGVARQIVEGLLAYPGRALMVFAWTTLGFAALDYAQSRLKLTHKWDPRTLPDVPRRYEWSLRGQALCELIASSAALVWLLLVPSMPVLMLGPAAAFLALAPIWTQLYVPMLAVLVAYHWWAPIVIVAAWLATHWLLRESAVWKDRETPEVRAAQRHADYAYRLAVDAPSAKALRLFGLGPRPPRRGLDAVRRLRRCRRHAARRQRSHGRGADRLGRRQRLVRCIRGGGPGRSLVMRLNQSA